MLNLGLRFKLFRVCSGLKQRDVADTLDVSVNYVSMIERGKREPTLSYLRKFAALVKAPASILLWEPAEEPQGDIEAHELRQKIAALMVEYASTQGLTPKLGS